MAHAKPQLRPSMEREGPLVSAAFGRNCQRRSLAGEICRLRTRNHQLSCHVSGARKGRGKVAISRQKLSAGPSFSQPPRPASNASRFWEDAILGRLRQVTVRSGKIERPAGGGRKTRAARGSFRVV